MRHYSPKKGKKGKSKKTPTKKDTDWGITENISSKHLKRYTIIDKKSGSEE